MYTSVHKRESRILCNVLNVSMMRIAIARQIVTGKVKNKLLRGTGLFLGGEIEVSP